MRNELDVTKLTDDGLDNLIENHEREGATGSPLYGSAIAERLRRKSPALKVERSVEVIRQVAREDGRFPSYGELAAAHGAEWDKVRYQMFSHLGDLVKFGLSQGWPMLSAMVVNKDNVETGKMDDATLEGFIRCARAFKLSIGNEEDFLHRQQEACREWARAR